MQGKASRNPDLPTRDEWPTILKARLDTLDAATKAATDGQGLPVEWRSGWTCRVSFLGRDRSGAILVCLTARGPQLREPYVRRLRLVKESKLKLRSRVR